MSEPKMYVPAVITKTYFCKLKPISFLLTFTKINFNPMNGYWTEEEMILTLKNFDFAFYCIIYYKIINIGNSSNNNIDYYFIHFRYHHLCQHFYQGRIQRF